MKLQCKWCDKPINGDFELRGWSWKIDPDKNPEHERGSDGGTRVHPECAKAIDRLERELKAKETKEHEDHVNNNRERLGATPASRVVDSQYGINLRFLRDDAGYDHIEAYKIQSRETQQRLRKTERLLRKSGFDQELTFREFWEDASPELEYAEQQQEALTYHQDQLRRLRTIVDAKQVQVKCLKMPHDLQVLFIRTLTSDPGGKIAKLFELEGKLPNKKQLPGVAPKRLTVGKEKKDN
jgi:hypothetical protein